VIDRGLKLFPAHTFRRRLSNGLSESALDLYQTDHISGKSHLDKNVNDFNLDNYVRAGLIGYEGITYEDFLPVSAAGIFQSNLSTNANHHIESQSSRHDFENALGCSVRDEMKLYEDLEKKSLQDCTFYFIR
jgi:Uncharacterized protein conserved in bacteria